MITISIDPILFSIGHFALRWYGVIVAGAIALGVWIASQEARRRGFPMGEFQDSISWVIAGGLVGARLFHVIDHWPHEYAADPIRALYLWEGGLAIWGAVAGGMTALAVFAARRRLALGLLADIAAPGLVAAQAFGRLACVITGDAVGPATTGPIGFAYTNPGAMVPQLGVFYTPMPAFEVVVNAGIFLVLWRLRLRKWPHGLLFVVYLAAYSLARFLLAYTSAYQIVAFGLTQSQIVAVVGLGVAALTAVRLLRLRPTGPLAPAGSGRS